MSANQKLRPPRAPFVSMQISQSGTVLYLSLLMRQCLQADLDLIQVHNTSTGEKVRSFYRFGCFLESK
jgi:hypothetical protein